MDKKRDNKMEKNLEKDLEKNLEKKSENLTRPDIGIAREIYDKHSKHLEELSEDPAFLSSFEKLDVEKFSELLESFMDNSRHYNAFHRQERRLWSIKIGRGKIKKEQEDKFRKSIPSGREHYIKAFDDMNEIHSLLGKSGFGPVIEEHLPSFTSVLADPNDPISKVVRNLAADMGSSKNMIDKLLCSVADVDYDFLKVAGGFEGLAEVSHNGVKAQLEIFKETEENGFDYIRGECGPPAWAIAASQILASVGISVGAWWLVAGVLVFYAILLAICKASKKGSWLHKQCKKLNTKIPVLIW